MVFKEFGKDVISLAKNYNTLNVMTKEQSVDVQQLVEDFNRLKNSGSLVGDKYQEQIRKVEALNNDNLTNVFQQVAEGAENARVNIVDAYAAILDGNTHGLKNVQGIMNTFNNAFDGNVEKQKEFAKAVGQSNKTLGVYLNSLGEGATADLKNYGAELVKAKAKTIGLTIKTAALNTLLSVGMSLAITGVITLISKAISKQEEAKQKAEELKQKTIENAEAAKEELNSISDLISQYEKFKDVTSLTADDKATLKSIQDELVKTFGKEAEGVDLVNGEYREQLGLLQGIKQEKANQNINALISNKDTVKKEYDDNVKNTFEYYGGGDEDFYHNSEYVAMIKKLIQNNPAFTDDISYSGWGAQYGKTVGSANITLSDNLNAEEKVQALQEALEYMRAEGYTDNELFRYFSNIQQHYQEEVDNYNNALKDLAQGYIDAFEPLKDDTTLKEFNEWKDKLLESIDDEEVKSATSELVDSLYKEISSTPNNTTILNLDKVSEEAKTSLSEYEDKISDFLSEKDKIDSALKEQGENGSISVSTAFELSKLGYKSAVKYDSETKAYKLLRSEINKTAESRIAETKAKLESEKASAIQSIKDETENWRKNTGRTKDDIMYLDKLEKNKVAINEISNAYDLYISMLGVADDTTSEYADSIERVNEELENQKTEIEKLESGTSTIDKAIEEQKEFGHLSASSIKALHEAGLGTALAYNDATGETTLLIDSVEELYKAMIKAQEEAAKISLNNLATEIEAIENRLNNFSVNSVGDFQKKSELESDLAEKQSQYDEQSQNLQIFSSLNFDFNSTVENSVEEAAEEYIKSVKEAFEKEKNNLDYALDLELISQEDYYNQLALLNERYFKGKSEFLDEYQKYEVEIYKGLKQIQEEQISAAKEAFDNEKSNLDYALNMELISQEEYYNRLNMLNEQYFKGKSEFLDEYRQYEVEVFKGLKQIQEDQINAVKEAFEKEKSMLDYALDMDVIKQEDYYNQLTKLNEKYFKGKENFLDEYQKYEVEIYKGLKQIQEEQTEKQINSLKEAFNKEKSELDHLNSMNAISQEDYYNKLFELNEKYFKGKTELLDEYRQYEEEVYKGLKEVQIKALQEQIDALKSVNEEKQEEIDLEKAKQALENAKRQKKVKVYDSERGWIRETDKTAIDSAQKEYDDLVLNEKVETLENLIDVIENGTNTNHQLDESVNAVEQVNSLGQRVISGNVDLAQLFSGAVANRMNEIQNSVNSNTPIALANQFDKGISSDSYTTNNNATITLNGVTVMANNPEEFISQMEQIANESFKENFPTAMNQFGRDLKRYKMNHSL